MQSKNAKRAGIIDRTELEWAKHGRKGREKPELEQMPATCERPKFVDAIRICSANISKPDSFLNYGHRADAYFMLGEYAEALSDYDLELKTKTEKGYLVAVRYSSADISNRGDTHFRLKNFREAARDYRMSNAMNAYSPSLGVQFFQNQRIPHTLGNC